MGKKKAVKSRGKMRMIRQWLRELNCWGVPKNGFLHDQIWAGMAESNAEKQYIRGAYDAIENVLRILESRP